MKIKKFDLGFVKVEHHTYDVPEKQPLIKIEKSAKTDTSYKPNLESDINIQVTKNISEPVKKEKQIKPKDGKQKTFRSMIGEINFLFYNLIAFDTVLASITIFLLSYIFLTLFDLDKIYSIVPPIVYIAIYLFFKLRENYYIKVEQKFTKLNEKIRTAADNINMENPVVDELKHEVSQELKDVDYASFFRDKRTSYHILLIILLCVTLVFLAKYDVEFKLDFIQDKIFGFINGGNGNETGIISDIISATTSGNDEDIFGEEQLAKLGDDKLTININKLGYEINLNDVKDPTKQDFEESLFPEDVGLDEAEVYNKRLPKEDQELVKNYFWNLAQG